MTNRPTLVPDDDEVNRLLRQAEDFLGVVKASEDVSAEEDPDPWLLPAPISGGAAGEALDRIMAAVWDQVTPPHRQDEPQGPQMYGPDGRYEHMPLRLVDVDQADVDVLAATVQVCRRALDRDSGSDDEEQRRLSDLREVLEDADLDASPWGGRAPIAGKDKLVPLGKLVELLTLSPDDDSRALADAIAAADGRDVVLTADQEDAYQRIAARFNKLVAGGDPLHRYQF